MAQKIRTTEIRSAASTLKKIPTSPVVEDKNRESSIYSNGGLNQSLSSLSVDTHSKVKMMKLLVVALLVVVAVYAQDSTVAPTHHTKHPHTQHPHTQHPHTQHAHTQHPHTTHGPNAHQMIKTTFTMVDADKDGMLSLKEMDAAFTAADTDKDGHISMAEYQTAHSTEDPAIVQAMYKYFDVNDNGKLDHSDVKIAFHHFDVDSDTHVSLHEFTVEYTAVHKLLLQASHHTSKPLVG